MTFLPAVSRRSGSVMGVLVATALSSVGNAAAQTLEPNLWIPDGPVNAVARHGDTIYIGGDFNLVGPPTGAHAAFDAGTGDLVAASLSRVHGTVHTIIPDGAGGVYIGGVFSHVGDQPRSSLAQIAADGSLGAWNPGVNGAVYALLRDPGGSVYVGGDFSQLGGVGRANLGEVSAAGTTSGWNPTTDAPVYALEQNGTTLYVGGAFAAAANRIRQHIVAIPKGSITATNWNPSANGPVHCLKVINHFVFGQGFVTTLLVGGNFGAIGGQARNNAANLSLSTGAAQPWNPNTNGTVRAFADQGVELYLAGDFTTVGGQARSYVACVNDMTGAVNGWVPSVNAPVHALLLKNSNTEIVIGGRFSLAGGQPRHGLASLDVTTVPGPATAWNPRPNEDVLALAGIGSSIHAGGEFTAANNVIRSNVAALDRVSGAATAWAPSITSGLPVEVRALDLNIVGGVVASVYVGGEFIEAGGQPRSNLAEIDAASGLATPWNPMVTGSVYALDREGSLLYIGGFLGQVGGQLRDGLAAVDVVTGIPNGFNPEMDNTVLAVEATPQAVYAGGVFTTVNGASRPHLVALSPGGGNLALNYSLNAPVRALAVVGDRLFVGGDFTLPRKRLAQIQIHPGFWSLLAWSPDISGPVRSLVPGGDVVAFGGDFATVNSLARNGVAMVDATTGATDPWQAQFSSGSVKALSVHGSDVVAGGTFTSVESQGSPYLALIEGGNPLVTCPNGPLVSQAGSRPGVLVPFNLDNDGIRDLLVLNDVEYPYYATVLRGGGSGGVGDGTFASVNTLYLDERPSHAAAADIDADGFDDLAIAQNGSTSFVTVFYNLPITNGWGATSPYPVHGRAEGIALADLDQDGILDIAVCLQDSASVPDKGGVLVLKGWTDPFARGFSMGPRLPSQSAFAQRVLTQDMDNDGLLDLLYSPSVVGFVRMQPGLTYACYTPTGTPPVVSPTALVPGDFNGDSRVDVAVMNRRQIRVQRNEPLAPTGCTFRTVGTDTLDLPSSGRDLAVLDYDLDGTLDLVCSLDSLDQVLLFTGQDSAGVPNGKFDLPVNLGSMDAWGLAVGDFVGNGSPDLVVANHTCGTVTVIPQGSPPMLAMDLEVVSPNGGEVWPPASTPPLEASAPASAPLADDAPPAEATAPLASRADPARLASTQQIEWTKGAGIPAVDVEISRDGVTGWQPIATNVPGTSMTWIVTPLATTSARIRVRDSAVASRSDASDGTFEIPGAAVGVEPGAEVVAFRLQDANPARSAMRFRMELPSAADVRIEIYDPAGRLVRTLARRTLPAGGHDLSWDLRDEHGRACVRGVYFVRARTGTFEVSRKVVLVG